MDKWVSNFNPRKFEFSKNALWIRLYELQAEYWDIQILKEIAKGLGELRTIDDIIVDEAWGSYASNINI